jgi:uncharacterized tellurite resistance protein B-like protein
MSPELSLILYKMFDKLKNLLAGGQENENVTGEMSDSMRVRVATAVILLEVAYADDNFSPQEHARIIAILKKAFNLDKREVDELLEVAEEVREGSIDIWHFTNIINENFNDEEKYSVIDKIWQIIYADGRLDKYEDHIVHKLSNLLHVPHSRMIEAKLKNIPE